MLLKFPCYPSLTLYSESLKTTNCSGRFHVFFLQVVKIITFLSLENIAAIIYQVNEAGKLFHFQSILIIKREKEPPVSE